MNPVASTIRDLLARIEAGEVVGVAWCANEKGGRVRSGFAGDLGGRIATLANLTTGDREPMEGARC